MNGQEAVKVGRKRTATTAIRWSARVLGLAVFLFWGAFFVGHLQWFSHPSQLPPA